MLLVTMSLLFFCPNVGIPLNHPPPREEVLAYLASNPLPFEMTQDLFHVTDFHINTAAFIQSADTELVTQLMEDSNAQQRALGLVAAMALKMPNHVQHLLAAIDDESPIQVAKPMDTQLKTLSDLVWHWFNMSLLRYEKEWRPGSLAKITAADQMAIFEAYLTRGLPRHRGLLLTHYTAPNRFEDRIRERAESGDAAALPALARFQKHTDVAWLALSLEPDEPDNPAWRAAAIMPDPTYLPAVALALQKVFAEDAAPRNTSYLFDALVAQDGAATRDLITAFFNRLDLTRPTHTKLLFDYFRCATRDTTSISKQEDLLLQAVRQFHIINEVTFLHFAGKSAALKKELLESLWRDPLMIYTASDFPLFMLGDVFLGIDDPQYLAYLGVEIGTLKANHPHVQKSWYE